MRRFLVYQIRDKESRNQCVSSRKHSNKRAKCETMPQWEIGRGRASAWISSGKIKSIPDLSTGSEEPEMLAYFVPSHAEIFEETNKVSRSISNATNACEVDVQDMDVLQDNGPGSSTDVSLKRDGDKFNQRVNEFLAKPVVLLHTLQDQSNAVKVLISEASKNKFLRVRGVWPQQIQHKVQAQSLDNSRVGGSVHVNAEQVSIIVCKLVWCTSFLTEHSAVWS